MTRASQEQALPEAFGRPDEGMTGSLASALALLVQAAQGDGDNEGEPQDCTAVHRVHEATGTAYPHPPNARAAQASAELQAALAQGLGSGGMAAARGPGGRLVCSIDNGTASRETEAWLREQLRTLDSGAGPDPSCIGYIILDEAGASVYSASPLAARELPDLDVTLRGAVSIARRLLDPLSELVKMDPHSIGSASTSTTWTRSASRGS